MQDLCENNTRRDGYDCYENKTMEKLCKCWNVDLHSQMRVWLDGGFVVRNLDGHQANLCVVSFVSFIAIAASLITLLSFLYLTSIFITFFLLIPFFILLLLLFIINIILFQIEL